MDSKRGKWKKFDGQRKVKMGFRELKSPRVKQLKMYKATYLEKKQKSQIWKQYKEIEKLKKTKNMKKKKEKTKTNKLPKRHRATTLQLRRLMRENAIMLKHAKLKCQEENILKKLIEGDNKNYKNYRDITLLKKVLEKKYRKKTKTENRIERSATKKNLNKKLSDCRRLNPHCCLSFYGLNNLI